MCELLEKYYYTPKIEEFRIGFEFEMKSINGVWGYEKLTEKNIHHFFIMYFETSKKIQPKNICRVKYLDKSDIEQLGFEYVGDDKFTQILEKPLFTRVTHIYLRKANKIQKSFVTVHKDGGASHGVIFKYVDYVYNRIEIKNKFELNNLLEKLDLKQTQI